MRRPHSYNYCQNSEIGKIICCKSKVKTSLKSIKMIATAVAVAFVVYSCKGKLGVAEKLDLKETPVQVVENMYIVQTTNSRIEMRTEAALMERYERDTLSMQLFPKGFAVFGYTEDGLLETEIRADEACHQKFSDGRETWAAYKNVVVKNLINRETMETDTLYWDRQNEKIYTDCYVRLYSPDGFMQGYGMESDQRARNSVIFRPFNNYAVIVQDTTAVEIDTVNFIGPLQKK